MTRVVEVISRLCMEEISPLNCRQSTLTVTTSQGPGFLRPAGLWLWSIVETMLHYFNEEELALIVHYNATLKTRCDHCGIKKQPLLTILLPSYNGMPFSFRNLKLPKLENILIIKKLFRSYFCCVHSFRMYHCMSFWCLDIIKVAIFFKYVLKCVFSSLKSCWFTSYLLTSLQISILFSRRVQSYMPQSNLATRNLLANLRLYKSSCTAILICNFTSLLLRSNFNDSSNK